MKRLIHLAIAVFTTVIVTIVPSHALPPGSNPEPTYPCTGTSEHQAHGGANNNTCADVFNPHFSWMSETVTCESGGGALNCAGCVGCCNGRFNQQQYCTCVLQSGIAATFCTTAADHSRDTCIINCRSGTFSNSCDDVPDDYTIPGGEGGL